MEPVIFSSGRVSGVEVLYFPEAELIKAKGNSTSFGAIGPLSVLYFSEYKRFALQLNDWKYPLISKLNISGANGTYNLPALNGFTFTLKINDGAKEALNNLEVILKSTQSDENAADDKLVRHQLKNTGAKEVVAETIKGMVENVKNKVATMKTGTKNLTSTKKRINQDAIKTKDFKSTARSTFKEDFFKSAEKASQQFLTRRKENSNLNQAKDLAALKKTGSSNAPVFYICREDIEEAILNNKDLAKGLTA